MPSDPNTVSAYNTPQAVDDTYSLLERNLETLSGYIQWLDVMANDLGGKAKTLYSIDDADLLADLFQQDAQVTFESSALGALIYIKDGKIAYDATALAAQIDALGEGESLIDTLTYSIRLGNGTLSFGEVTITIAGANDAAEITGDIAGSVIEDAAAQSVSGELDATDVDGPDDSFVAVIAPAISALAFGTYTVDATGSWTYTLDSENASVEALGDGETLIDSFTVLTTDGTSALVQITILGAAEGITLPAVYTGADPNDGDSLVGNPTNLEGTQVANIIVGTSGIDVINGYGGNDTIDANHGADQVYGGAGNDTIYGNIGLDTLYGQSGDDTINGDENIDTIYGGSGADTINGGFGGDIVYGGSGNDIVAGAGANDVIIGGFGADTLTGGNLADIFRYLDLRDTGDIITDFTHGADKIDFAAIDADDAVAGNQAFSFGGTTATAHGAWYAADGSGNTSLYLDTDGNVATAELVITLNSITDLVANDFIL